MEGNTFQSIYPLNNKIDEDTEYTDIVRERTFASQRKQVKLLSVLMMGRGTFMNERTQTA